MNKLILLTSFLFFSCAIPKIKYVHKIEANVKKLCFIGDTGSHDSNQQKVSDMLLDEKCHSIHFLGDIIYEKGLKNHHDKNFHKKFWNFYKKLTVSGNKPTLYMTMGNHDHHKSIDAWIRLSEKHPKIFYPHPYYLVKFDDVCMVHFDTDYFLLYANYLQMFSQMRWLKEVKDDIKDCRVKIALGHHPYNSSAEDHGNSGWPLRTILKKHIIGKYDYLFSGHEHVLADEGAVEGTRLIISGAGGKVDTGYVNGYVVMTLKGMEKPVIEFRQAN